eukprot:297264-Pyramimonas_sp.AAC.1
MAERDKLETAALKIHSVALEIRTVALKIHTVGVVSQWVSRAPRGGFEWRSGGLTAAPLSQSRLGRGEYARTGSQSREGREGNMPNSHRSC